ncbi:hypothetical protein KBZ12_07445 [Cyanobium sp. Cruz CV13-4-11]|jgi:hypothetical protein|uniref:hypothetical protein n=1 Tax=unclassified Cyanobium TaxID=2627006 RepID=UPI0020CC77ED|nr:MULTISPECIES: hypothetical protein [unclassified Cyanobium]MCP9900031.1 hypothetical protein [Cyanobium sp. Cruz CV11-17]MCP9919321.1 hypothetical protein [Cyanobium sp. Cruz CV13-4-11]
MWRVAAKGRTPAGGESGAEPAQATDAGSRAAGSGPARGPPAPCLPRRSILALATAAGLAAAIGGGVAFREHTRNGLTVTNRSGLTITSLEVSLPWQTLRFEPIADGASLSRSFRIVSDAHVAIEGELAEGTRLRAAEGYVTNGQYGEEVRIEVGPGGGIQLRQQRRGR